MTDTLTFDAEKSVIESIIISLVSESVLEIDFTFRNYHYVITHISWESASKKKKICVNANYTMIMIDRIFIPITVKVKKMIIKILIRDLKFKIHHFDEYAIYIFYMKDVLLDNTRVFAQITREIHIVDDFKANMLIEADILTSKRIIIDFVTQFIKIDSYRDIVVSINSRARFESIKRTIKSLSKIILPSRITILMSITYADDKLLEDRDLLFES